MPDIYLMGAVFPDVPAVTLPVNGGGTARFTDTSPTTATDADVANGKVYFKSDGTQSTGTGSGGGASNVVTGTFTGTTTGAAMDVTLNYTGNGYPIAVIIYPTGGLEGNSSYSSLVQRYALALWSGAKRKMSLAPAYSGQTTNYQDSMVATYMYKSSTSGANSYSQSGASNQTVYNDADASTPGGNTVKIRSKTKMSVYIASTSYGFAANIEYTYWIIYSS